jgi:MFS family permease
MVQWYLLRRVPGGFISSRLADCSIPCGKIDRLFSVQFALYTNFDITDRNRIIWGATLMLTALCFNAGGLLANRIFLGAFESVIGPGLTVIVAMWYKRSEQPLRHGAWFMGNVVAGIFGGLLAYAVGHVESIAPWKVNISLIHYYLMN